MVNTRLQWTPPNTYERTKAEREVFAVRFRKIRSEGMLLRRALGTFYSRIIAIGAHRGIKPAARELVYDHLHRRITTVGFMEGITTLCEHAPVDDAYIATIDRYIKTLYEKDAEMERLSDLIDRINDVLDSYEEDRMVT